MKTLTQEYVRQHLDYDPETGELRWREYKRGRKRDGSVGTVTRRGYLRVCVNRSSHQAHRIIWLWVYGYFPEADIDHIDRDKLNNRLSNLREVSRTCNSRNCGPRSDNKSGVRGVCWEPRYGKWAVRIKTRYKDADYLGRYEEYTEAVAHRLAAEQCLNWEGCDSNSSAYQYMNSIRRP